MKKKRRHINCNAHYLVRRVARAIPLLSFYPCAHIAATFLCKLAQHRHLIDALTPPPCHSTIPGVPAYEPYRTVIG